MSEPGGLRLLFVVGLSGVGKSTLLRALLKDRPALRLLPNRRELTDEIIIPEVQRLEGSARVAVRDRLERFRLTAAYRERHPRGMVQALACYLAEQNADGQLVFDNLRGLHEVRSAHERFPGSRFLLLDAPPLTRFERLLARHDPFDQAHLPAEAPGLAAQFAALEGVTQVFDLAELTAVARQRKDPHDAMLQAARIVVEEHRHYDNDAARRYLEAQLPAQRHLVIDTTNLEEDEVARRASSWLEGT